MPEKKNFDFVSVNIQLILQTSSPKINYNWPSWPLSQGHWGEAED